MVEAFTYLMYLAAAAVLIQVAIVDARTRRIPHGSLVALLAIWIVQCAVEGCTAGIPAAIEGLTHGLIAAVVLGGAILLIAIVFERLTGKHSIGGGDIKLIAILALFLGIDGSLVMLLIASILSLGAAIIVRKRTLPFAPFLVSGAVVVLLI